MEVYDIAVVPVIIALISVVGKMGFPSRYKPALALVLGVVGGVVYIAPGDPKQAVFMGVVMGLSSIGAFSGVKNTVE